MNRLDGYSIMNLIAGELETFDTQQEASDHMNLRIDDAMEFEKEMLRNGLSHTSLSESECRALYWIRDNQPETTEMIRPEIGSPNWRKIHDEDEMTEEEKHREQMRMTFSQFIKWEKLRRGN